MATDKLVYRQEPRLFVTLLTAQALFTLKMRRTKTQTAIPCECLLGDGVLRTQAAKRKRFYNKVCFLPNSQITHFTSTIYNHKIPFMRAMHAAEYLNIPHHI
ncbi:MAG TPA: hypothetical protein DD626_02460 [Clostridiales bacterium]|nr:hypothetical protein [Clostridiales bacterium]